MKSLTFLLMLTMGLTLQAQTPNKAGRTKVTAANPFDEADRQLLDLKRRYYEQRIQYIQLELWEALDFGNGRSYTADEQKFLLTFKGAPSAEATEALNASNDRPSKTFAEANARYIDTDARRMILATMLLKRLTPEKVRELTAKGIPLGLDDLYPQVAARHRR